MKNSIFALLCGLAVADIQDYNPGGRSFGGNGGVTGGYVSAGYQTLTNEYVDYGLINLAFGKEIKVSDVFEVLIEGSFGTGIQSDTDYDITSAFGVSSYAKFNVADTGLYFLAGAQYASFTTKLQDEIDSITTTDGGFGFGGGIGYNFTDQVSAEFRYTDMEIDDVNIKYSTFGVKYSF